MRTFAVFALLFAIAMAGPLEKAAEVLQTCVQEKSLNGDNIKQLLKNEVLPEDNNDLNVFFECYWTKLELFKDDKIDFTAVKSTMPHLLKKRYPQITDSDKLGEDATEHCKDIAFVQPAGLYIIKFRNCATNYAKSKIN